TSQVLTDPGHCLTRRSSALKVLAGFTGRVEHLTCVAYGGADVHCTVAVGVMQVLAGRCSASPASPPSAPVDAVARTEESPHVDPAVRPPPENPSARDRRCAGDGHRDASRHRPA